MKRKKYYYLSLLLVLSLGFSACSKPSEREAMQKKMSKAREKAWKEADKAITQMDMNIAAGRYATKEEAQFYKAAAFKIKQDPEEAENVLRDVFIIGQQVARIINAPDDDTGSAEPMMRRYAISSLYSGGIRIFLSDETEYQRWQRIKNASGKIQGDLVRFENGLCYLTAKFFDEDTDADWEFRLRPSLAITKNDSDYILIMKDVEKSATTQCFTPFFARIKDKKIVALKELPQVFIKDLKVENNFIVLRGHKRHDDQDKKPTIKIEISFEEMEKQDEDPKIAELIEI